GGLLRRAGPGATAGQRAVADDRRAKSPRVGLLVLPANLPARRPDLVIRPLGERGRYVVKDPRTGAFYTFGEQEHFLLLQLDGQRDAEAVCKAFEGRFGESLSKGDLDGFLELARKKGLLQPPPT